MLHTKFRENRSTGSREDFFKVFTIYGRGGHVGHVTWITYPNFGSPFPRALHIKFLLWFAKRFQRRRSLKMVDGRQRTPTPARWVYYKLTL